MTTRCEKCNVELDGLERTVKPIDGPNVFHRLNEIRGFIKGVKPGEKYPGEKEELEAEWGRQAAINTENARKHYAHIQARWGK